jgi:type I restriction enzyme S subunit
MKKCKLGELLEIKHGYAFKSENYVESGNIALVTLGNISENNNFQFFPEKNSYYGADFPADYILQEDDLIMPLTEQTIGLFGNSAFVPRIEGITFVLNQRVGKVIVKDGKADKFFLHYLLSTNEVRDQLENRANGTKQRNISPNDVYDVSVFVPELEEQKKIGYSLYLIEKKINNNLKIIETLENHMNNIFNTWFNLHNYPDSNNRMFAKNNKFNKVEEEWRDGKISEIMDFISGYSFLSDDYLKNGKYKLYTIKNVQDGFVDSKSDSYFNTLPDRMPKSCLLNIGDVIMSLTGNVGRVGIVYEGNTLLNQRVLKILPKNISKSFMYFYLRTGKMKAQLINLAHGTSQKNLSPVDFSNLKIKIPPTSIVEKFSKLSDNAFNIIKNKFVENQKLNDLREYLVPILLNNQIKIEE